ncbi:MAG: hypothetical protein LBC88_03400 [Spirochaetaceae bacterium]|jgi:hypothetical protein|nr:hypothetical protein [Spirochaetaceae bacterium]
MAGSVDWREKRYREIFADSVRGIMRRRERDPSFSAADLEGTLASLYIMDGADWGGRGEVQDISLSATIAAHERVLAEWRAETG